VNLFYPVVTEKLFMSTVYMVARNKTKCGKNLGSGFYLPPKSKNAKIIIFGVFPLKTHDKEF